MKKKCAFCDGTRLAFIWIVALGIIINAAYNLLYVRETLTIFQILKLPLIFCLVALLLKIFTTRDN
jgi:hypothetical protein